MFSKLAYFIIIFTCGLCWILWNCNEPYIASNYYRDICFYASSVLTVISFLTLFIYQSNPKRPTGFKLLAIKFKQRKWLDLTKFTMALPIVLVIVGSMYYWFLLFSPAYILQFYKGSEVVADVVCVDVHRSKRQGIINKLRLQNGQLVRLPGFNQMCSKENNRICSLHAERSFVGDYVTELKCTGS